MFYDSLFQVKLGMSLNRLSFYYSGYSLRGGDNRLDATTAKDLSMVSVDEAIQIFTEVIQSFLLLGFSTSVAFVC